MLRLATAVSLGLVLGATGASAINGIANDGIRATANAVTVPSVSAEKPGYLVVHTTDFTGTLPGSVIGHAAVPAGETANVSITLERAMEPGASVFVMLHEEGNGDTVFDASDLPATGATGPVKQIVTVE